MTPEKRIDVEEQIRWVEQSASIIDRGVNDISSSILSSLRELKALREAGNDIVSLLGDSGFMDVSRDLSCSKWLAVYAKLKSALAAVPHQEPPRV